MGRPLGSKNNTSITHKTCGKCSVQKSLNHLASLYGITPQEYADLLSEQRGLCAICEQDCLTGKALGVDHNHETGEIRGLLCSKCNQALGLLNDDIILFTKAMLYLQGGNKL